MRRSMGISPPVDSSAESYSGLKNSMGMEDGGKVEVGSRKCAEEKTSCSGSSFCVERKCKEEDCYQTGVAADGPCNDVARQEDVGIKH